MVVTERYPAVGSHRVEISGWDMDELFFVENADLEWREDADKRIKLRRPLRKGTIIFVRQLHSSTPKRVYPLAYEVEPIAAEDNGYCEYRLTPVRRRSKTPSPTIH
jgi:hypothetical protein